MRALRQLSLREKIVGLTLAAALPTLLFAAILAWQRVSDLRQARQASAVELATVAAALVDALVDSTEASLQALGTHPALVSGDAEASGALFRELLPRLPQHDNLIAVSLDGAVFANGRSLPPGGLNVADFPLFQSVIASGEPATSGVFEARLDGRPTVVSLAPIRGATGETVGAVGAHLDLATMHRIFAPLPSAPDTALISVNDVSGTIISRTVDADKTVGRSIGGTPLMEAVNSAFEGGGEIEFPDGQARVFGFARTSSAPWRVIVGIPTDAAYAQAQRSATVYAALIGGATALTLLLATMVAARLMRALDGLVARARAIGAGKAEHPASIPEGPELRTLGAAFDEMERALGATHAALERKVGELEAANRELQALDRAKSTFVASISHELRTPLTYLVGFSQILRDRPTTSEEVREMGGHMADAARRLSRMVDDIIHFSELEAVGVRIEPDSVCLDGLVRETLSQFPDQSGQVRSELPTDLPPVRADSLRIGQVITNLVSNAAKFSAPESEIVVRGRVTGEEVRLEVLDRGMGVDPAEADGLFEPFHRGDEARRRQVVGFGLGLAICKRIVDLHGGTIGVEHRDGGGSTFWFSLPAIWPSANGREREAPALAGAPVDSAT